MTDERGPETQARYHAWPMNAVTLLSWAARCTAILWGSHKLQLTLKNTERGMSGCIMVSGRVSLWVLTVPMPHFLILVDGPNFPGHPPPGTHQATHVSPLSFRVKPGATGSSPQWVSGVPFIHAAGVRRQVRVLGCRLEWELWDSQTTWR